MQAISFLRRTSFQWAIVFAVLVTGLLYWRTLDYPFTNWDDPQYITENEQLIPLSWEAVRTEFSREVAANYHPVTMLSYSLEVALFGKDAGAMHRTNLFLHLLNIVLVAAFLRRLTGDRMMTALAVVIWAVHPLRVESVAWLSARKDLLMLFFGLLMLLAYHRWKRKGDRWAYLASALAFALAGLSKGMAVSLVPILLLVDLYAADQRSLRAMLLDKIPFVLIALTIGLVTLRAQSAEIAVAGGSITVLERFLLGPANIVAYAVSTIAPMKLCARYVYPITNGSLPGWYVPVGLVTLAALLWIGWRTWRDRDLGIGPVKFGLWFFVLGLLPVLQWLPVGAAIRADRYTYMAGIGIALVLSWAVLWLADQLAPKRAIPVTLAIGCSFTGWLARTTSERIPVWSTPIAVRTDMIAGDPMGHVGYLDRAISYDRAGDTAAALADFDRAVARAGARDHKPRYDRGMFHLKHEHYELAMQDLLIVFQAGAGGRTLVPNMLFAQLGMGMCADVEGNATQALRSDSTSLDIWNIRAACRIEQGDTRGAFADLVGSLHLDRTKQETWLLMAWAFRTHGRPDMACRIMGAGLVVGPMLHPWLQGRLRTERDHCAIGTGS